MPTDNSCIGQVARKCEPYMRQVFVTGDQEFDVLNRQVCHLFISSKFHLSVYNKLLLRINAKLYDDKSCLLKFIIHSKFVTPFIFLMA